MANGATAVVGEANDPLEAEIWVDALRRSGIEAASFERGPGPALGGAATVGFASYPVLVPADQIAAARNVIAELAGGSRLAPYRDPVAARRTQRRLLLVLGGGALAIIVAGVLGKLVNG